MKPLLTLLADLDSLELSALEAVVDRLQHEGVGGPVDYETLIDEITSLPRERLRELANAAPKAVRPKTEEDSLVMARTYELTLENLDYEDAKAQAEDEMARGKLRPRKPLGGLAPPHRREEREPRRQKRVLRGRDRVERPSPLSGEDNPPQPARSGGQRHADEGAESDHSVIGGVIVAGGRSGRVRLDGELAWVRGRGSR